eukprot:m.159229 g.159229  ORF g.159229 m.159229 type:complete len:794 (+) comp11755_c0_seq1:136-2517(+)
MSKTLCVAFFGLVASVTAQPQISSDSNDITLSAPSGDINIETDALQCNGGSVCGIGAALDSMMTAQSAAMSALTAQSTMIDSMNTTMGTLATRTFVEETATATEAYALDLVVELANLTNRSAVDTIIQSHLDLGILHENGTLLNDLIVTSDADFSSLLPLFNHIQHIQGNVRIQSLQGITAIGGAFTRLQTVTGSVTIQYCNGLRDLNNTMRNLTDIGGSLIIRYNNNLQSYGSAFPALVNLGGALQITNNGNAAGLGPGMFSNLRMLNGAALPSNFNPQTMIYLGDAYYYPSASRGFSSYAALEQAISTTVILTGDIYLRNMPASVTDISGLGPQLKSVGGQVFLYNNDGIASLNDVLPNVEAVGGNVYMYGCDGVTSANNYLRSVRSIGGQIYIYYNRQLASMTGAFASVTTLGSSFYLGYNDQLATIPPMSAVTSMRGSVSLYRVRITTLPSTFFGNLQSASQISIRYCNQLTSMNGAFPELVNLTSQVYMYQNTFLATMTGAFPKLETVRYTISLSYLNRLTGLDNTVFPMLTTCAGVQLRYCFRTSVGSTASRTMNGIFPRLTSVGTSGIYFYYNPYFGSMTGAFPQLVTNSGYFYMYYCRYMTSFSGSFPRMTSVGTQMYMSANGFTSMDGAFPVLASVGSYVTIQSSYSLTSMNNAFTQLRTVGGNLVVQSNSRLLTMTTSFGSVTGVSGYFYLNNNRVLNNIQNSFTSLATVSGNFYMYGNRALQTTSNAFNSLTTISGSLRFYSNHANTCTSADQYLCPATSSWVVSSTSTCCNAYCNQAGVSC